MYQCMLINRRPYQFKLCVPVVFGQFAKTGHSTSSKYTSCLLSKLAEAIEHAALSSVRKALVCEHRQVLQLGAHMHTTMVEDHGHGAPVGDLSIEAGDLSLDQVHEGLTLCAHATATCKDCQGTAGTHRQPQCNELWTDCSQSALVI